MLRGTLKNFGIADVFQLIGNQVKTGVLTVVRAQRQITLSFADGRLMATADPSRRQRDLLGSMLLRAELITEAQLADALAEHSALQASDPGAAGSRVGDILIRRKIVDSQTLKSFVRLQDAETVYRVFLWDTGTYVFERQAVSPSPTDPESLELEYPRADSLLLEAFRQADGWPAIREQISSYGMVFARAADLDELLHRHGLSLSGASSDRGGAEHFDDLDELGDWGADSLDGDSAENAEKQRLKQIGHPERLVYDLVAADRDTQKIIDLGRLGEFDTCQALVRLLDAGIITSVSDKTPSAHATVGGIHDGRRQAQVQGVAAMSLAVLFLVAVWWGVRGARVGGTEAADSFGPVFRLQQVARHLSTATEARLHEALAVYRALYGSYPAELTDLVRADLLTSQALRYPWQEPYAYWVDTQTGQSYRLARPFY